MTYDIHSSIMQDILCTLMYTFYGSNKKTYNNDERWQMSG